MSIEQFLLQAEAEVAAGWLSRHDHGPLSQYTYTQECQFAGHWNEVTMACRGLIVDREKKQFVARPFRKFFNWSENEWSTPDKFPLWAQPGDPGVEITKKMDGSLGIIFHHDCEWHVATKGSFGSEQALWALDWINKQWDLKQLQPERTYLVEIVYPENRIVLKYTEPGLILLAQIDTITGYEFPRENLEGLGQDLRCPVVETCAFNNVNDMLNHAVTLTHEEGWVVRWLNGNKRAKIKTEWYRKMHRIVSNLSPLALWESLDSNGVVDEKYWQSIPEELRPDVQWMKDTLETRFLRESSKVWQAVDRVCRMTPWFKNPTRDQAKVLSGAIMIEKEDWIRSCLFAMIRDKDWTTIIKERLRPKANNLEIA